MKVKQKLVIVESPAKSKTIAKFLGEGYSVVASMGHVRDLPIHRIGIDVKNNFEPQYEINKQRKKLIDELIKEAKKSECIYLAPDPDREGEAIAWHLYEILKEHCPNFKRVQFNEITQSAVSAAFDKQGEIDFNRVNSQQARRLIDRLVGYKISPLLQAKKPGAMSAGRVQTVALWIIVQREKAIRAFVPQEYWSLKANILNGKANFEVQLAKINDDKVDIPNEESMKSILGTLKGQKLIFERMVVTPKKRHPYPPFITSTIQQAASSMLGISPSQTMRIAQQLYEGIETAEGTVGLITYMRTDSVAISNEAKGMAKSFIESSFGSDYLAPKGKTFKSKGAAQEAHEAIRPTSVMRTPDEIASYLDDRQLKLYSLIWRRFVASQMASAQFEQRAMELMNEKEGRYLFKTTINKLIFPGFLRVYKEEDLSKEAELPSLVEGNSYDVKDLLPNQHFTEAPPRFSEATLVKELEANNIGRPSTYASIVRTIQDREYVEKTKGRLHPNNKGEEVSDYLIKHFSNLFAVKFTAEMEENLDLIEDGNADWKSILSLFYDNLQEWILNVKREGAIDDEKVLLVVDALLNADIKWAEPKKVGRRVYDDKAFVESIKEQGQKEESLFSEKQWYALIKIFVRYLDGLSSKEEVIKQGNLAELIADIHKQGEGAEVDVKRIDLLKDVQFDEPITKGKRVYDDKKFYISLKGQAESGKSLSERQLKALISIMEKYKSQIDNFDNKMLGLNLEVTKKDENLYANLKKFISLFDKIEVWNEPVTKGKRVYDDNDFINSLRQQLEVNYSLSERQIAAAKRVLKKYVKFIPNYEKILEGLGI